MVMVVAHHFESFLCARKAAVVSFVALSTGYIANDRVATASTTYVVAVAGTRRPCVERDGPPAKIWSKPAAMPITVPVCQA